MRLRLLTAACLILFAGMVASQSPVEREYEAIGVAPAYGVAFLETRNPRDGVWVSYQRVKPEPRFHFQGQDAQMVVEPYVIYSKSRYGSSIDELGHFGVLVTARYWRTDREFIDLGFGVQYVNDETADYGSPLNTTPTIGYGWLVDVGGRDAYLSLRFHHVSNAGTQVPNTGGNFLLLTFAYPF